MKVKNILNFDKSNVIIWTNGKATGGNMFYIVDPQRAAEMIKDKYFTNCRQALQMLNKISLMSL